MLDFEQFREPLPDGCPPTDAWVIQHELFVFRFVKYDPPNEIDFESHQARGVAKPTVCPCRSRGLSVFATEDRKALLQKLPFFKKKKFCRIRLEQGAGRLLQTSEPPHHTWWPFAGYDILANCEVLDS